MSLKGATIAVAHVAIQKLRHLTLREKSFGKECLQTNNSVQLGTSCELKSILKIRKESPSAKRSVRYSSHAMEKAKYREKSLPLRMLSNCQEAKVREVRLHHRFIKERK